MATSRPGALTFLLLAWLSAVGLAQAPSSTGAALRATDAPEDSLEAVLARSAAYVAGFQKQLSGIVAEESYVQEAMSGPVTRQAIGGPARERRVLQSDFLLVRPEGAARHIEFRDVFQVNGAAVRDRQDRLTRLFLEPGNIDRAAAIIEESARYNIGNIPRNVNTPMLALSFLQASYQSRFRFTRARAGVPSLNALSLARSSPGAATFRVSTEMWVVEFDERQRSTIIRTNAGKDFPAKGRFWIDPATGAVLMSELVMESIGVNAVINVSYQSEPLLGFRVPAEMRERYHAGSDRVEGVATYGPFASFRCTRAKTSLCPRSSRRQSRPASHRRLPLDNRDNQHEDTKDRKTAVDRRLTGASPMRTVIGIAMAVALVASMAAPALAAEETHKGSLMCAKCTLKKADAHECQDVLVVTDMQGVKTEYYVTKNAVAEKAGEACTLEIKATVTGTVSEKDGRKWITPSKIEKT